MFFHFQPAIQTNFVFQNTSSFATYFIQTEKDMNQSHSFIVALYNTNDYNNLNRYVLNPFWMIGFISYCFK